MKVTLHDVAARAGLSIATVSRAVNGLPVSKDSLVRVTKAVAELGYVPNEAARALRTDQTLTIGVIFADLRNTLGIELLDALSESVEDAGYSLIISTARGSAERYDILMHRFLERRIDGLFCVRPPNSSESLARYAALNIPVIAMFEGGGVFAELPLVRPVFNEAATAVADHLRRQGHARVALVRQEGRSPAMLAIAEALRAEDMHEDIVEPSAGLSSADLISSLMDGPGRATAVVAADPQARGLLAACRAAGARVPEDVSIISVNGIAADAYYRKHGISSVTIDPHRVGRAAGSYMLAWLAGSRPAQKIRVQTATFVARDTIRATVAPEEG
ncbi:MAG: LacI family DNA-binding transcriptional regulator [Dehalococcoidia bacterium]